MEAKMSKVTTASVIKSAITRLFDTPTCTPKHLTYRPFTAESYQILLLREVEDKRRNEEKERRANDAFLKDGELKFGINDDDNLTEKKMDRNPDLRQGKLLKEDEYGNIPNHLLGVPLEEIDQAIREKTFVVISRRGRHAKYIKRFSASPAFYCLNAWSRVRRIAVYIEVNQVFDFVIFVTILLNCIALTYTDAEASVLNIAEYVFSGIYFCEMVIKMSSRGLIIDKYTYLRDPWNWLDLIVILSAVVTFFWNLIDTSTVDRSSSSSQAIRIFRVLRVFKTVSIFPGLRTIVNAMLRASKMLFEVTLLTMFTMMLFSVFSLELYQGTLRQKCVKNPATFNFTKGNMNYAYFYRSILKNTEYWEKDSKGNYKLCGNASWAQSCSEGYICQPHIGENPDFGYTNFDTFGWAMLMSFQLMTLDFWENCYFKVLATSGPLSVPFFVLTVFFGSFYLLNLMLAVVAITYEEEAQRTHKELEKENEKTKKHATFYDLTLFTAGATAFAYYGLGKRQGKADSPEETGQKKLENVIRVRRQVRHWVKKHRSLHALTHTHYFVAYATKNRTPVEVQRNVLMAARKWRAYAHMCRQARLSRTKKRRINLLENTAAISNQTDNFPAEDEGCKPVRKRKIGVGRHTISSMKDGSRQPPRDHTPVLKKKANLWPLWSETKAMKRESSTQGKSVQKHSLPSYSASARERMKFKPKASTREGVYLNPEGRSESIGQQKDLLAEPHVVQKSHTKSNSDSSVISDLTEKSADKRTSTELPARRKWGDFHTSRGNKPQEKLCVPGHSRGFVGETEQGSAASIKNENLLEVIEEVTSQGQSNTDNLIPSELITGVAVDSDSWQACDETDEENVQSVRIPTRGSKRMPDAGDESQNALDTDLPKKPIVSDEGRVRGASLSPSIRSMVLRAQMSQRGARKRIKPPQLSPIDSGAYMEGHGTSSQWDWGKELDADDFSIDEGENDETSKSIALKATVAERILSTSCWRRCSRLFECWSGIWKKLSEKALIVVSDVFFSIFINFAIVINTVFMSLEHDQMQKSIAAILHISSYVFTAIYSIEALLKMMGYGLKGYFKVSWNIFDFVIVIISLVSFAMILVGEGGYYMPGFLVFRAFRLLRVLKLAQVWPAMNTLLTIISNTLGAVGNLTVILVVILFSFAVIGLQTFNQQYTKANFPNGVPRWNFQDFWHSFIMVFRVLCGEWIEPLWDCLHIEYPQSVDGWCMIVFFPTLIFGNFVVLNLFLALLLNSFGSGNLKSPEQSMDEVGRFHTVKTRCKKLLFFCPGMRHKLSKGDIMKIHLPEERLPVTCLDTQLEILRSRAKGHMESSSLTDEQISDPSKSLQYDSKGYTIAEETMRRQMEEEQVKPKPSSWAVGEVSAEQRQLQLEAGPPPCCCACCYRGSSACSDKLGRGRVCKFLHSVRVRVFKFVENDFFDSFVLMLIMVSSIALAFEDVSLVEKPDMAELIKEMNQVFCWLFVAEMIMRWIAHGFLKYFTSVSTVIDFVVVLVSVLSVFNDAFEDYIGTGGNKEMGGIFDAFRAVRTLRALRPLRAISRIQGMKIVVNSLMRAIPAILNVFLVSMVFWLIFSVMGVQFFAGMFWKCIDSEGRKVEPTVIANKSQCLERTSEGYMWINSKINFDDVFHSLLALFQMATFEGWLEIMEDAVDATGKDQQPKYENSMFSYIYFVCFILCGSFFTLNLVVGVIIDNFNVLKKKYEGSYLDAFLTEHQRNYYNTLKKMSTRRPQKTIKRPQNKFRQIFYDLAVSNRFEMIIMSIVFLNLIVMASEYYRVSCFWRDILDTANIAFATFFMLEALAKIIGLRGFYFTQPWHLYDFFVAVISISYSLSTSVNHMFDEREATIVRSLFLAPTTLRVVRIFRIGRVLRLIKVAKGIRKLVFALVISLPACLNVMALLLLCMFIYAIFGMFLFSQVKFTGALSQQINFRSFINTTLLLLSAATAAGWNEILSPLMISPPFCNNTHYQLNNGSWHEKWPGECGVTLLAIPYMVTYIILTYLIIINMYIAVILENYNQAHHQEEIGVTEDDFDMFYSVWERYDPRATQFIHYNQLSDFVDDLEPPLGIPKPNDIALVSFNLPILTGDRIHCLDILLALVKNVLTDVEESDDLLSLREQMNAKFASVFPHRHKANVISTTMRRKKEDVAARTLQRAWLIVKTRQAMKLIMTFAVVETMRRSNRHEAEQTNGVELLRKNLAIALELYFKMLFETDRQQHDDDSHSDSSSASVISLSDHLKEADESSASGSIVGRSSASGITLGVPPQSSSVSGTAANVAQRGDTVSRNALVVAPNVNSVSGTALGVAPRVNSVSGKALGVAPHVKSVSGNAKGSNSRLGETRTHKPTPSAGFASYSSVP